MCDHIKLRAFERYLVYFSLQPKHLSSCNKKFTVKRGKEHVAKAYTKGNYRA